MPRDLPLGNGKMLLNFDHLYRIRDIYYPRVGGENHTGGSPSRFGVYCEQWLGWVHDDNWTRTLDYQDETMVTQVSLHCPQAQLTLLCNDIVDFHESIFLRRIRVVNEADRHRQVRLFFSHNFNISDFDVGDTAYYHPYSKSLIHYKGPRYFLMNTLTPTGSGFDDFAIGFKGLGREGTWRDAEWDGALGKNPISQGSVDSTGGVYVNVPANAEETCWYWIVAGEQYQDVNVLNHLILDKKPETLLNRTRSYWQLWTNKDDFEFADLPASVVKLYKRSLFILRTQIDNGGAIIAANDTDITQFNRDTYSYMWPRDGALVAHALDIAGYSSKSLNFYNFCNPLLTKEGFFLHKYNPDGSAGSSWHPWIHGTEPQIPIQEDETALVIWALWKHFNKFREVETIKPLYRDMIIRAGHFMVQYMDTERNLPLPSYDLWEERRGIHAWTIGATYGGLSAAANFAEAFGEMDEANRFREAAQRIQTGAETWLWRPEAGRFVRTLNFDEQGNLQIDWTLDSSMIGLVLFGMYEPNDPRVVDTARAIYNRLWIKTSVGGMARYENDYYHQVSKDIQNVAGNPWFICTLWGAQYQIARATTKEELDRALPMLQWVVDHALPSGVLAEQVDPYSHVPLSVSPLTWSHATFVTTVIEYLDKLSELSECPACKQPLFTKERRKLSKDRAHKQITIPTITGVS